MFSVLLMVCALEGGSVTDNCFEMRDTWGPYRTEENCHIRLKQMSALLKENEEINYYVSYTLGFPDYIAITVASCNEDNSKGMGA